MLLQTNKNSLQSQHVTANRNNLPNPSVMLLQTNKIAFKVSTLLQIETAFQTHQSCYCKQTTTTTKTTKNSLQNQHVTANYIYPSKRSMLLVSNRKTLQTQCAVDVTRWHVCAGPDSLEEHQSFLGVPRQNAEENSRSRYVWKVSMNHFAFLQFFFYRHFVVTVVVDVVVVVWELFHLFLSEHVSLKSSKWSSRLHRFHLFLFIYWGGGIKTLYHWFERWQGVKKMDYMS